MKNMKNWWIFPSFHKKISKNLCLYFNNKDNNKINQNKNI